jgi:hypothetical protein
MLFDLVLKSQNSSKMIKNNTDETPLLVKIIPATQDQITAKTVYIRDTDDDGELTVECVEYNVKESVCYLQKWQRAHPQG